KSISPGEIDAVHRQRLLQGGDQDRIARAEKLLSSSSNDRKAVLKQYEAVLTQRGDPARGAAVFGKVCASCHKFGGQGHEVGPDLAALTDKSVDALMTAILDPNREVDARYASYTAALTDGRVLSGLIAAETASAITLKRQEGQADVILRGDLEALKTDGHSLMPEGLEKDLSPTALADVIAYVASGAIAPKSFAGNRPEIVTPATDGSLRLPASAAAIFGDTLAFETEFGNLGYWQSPSDRAVWTFRVDRPRTFTVTMEWACADDAAGNAFEARFGDRALTGVVGGTGAGTWANYRSIFVGEVTLSAGNHRCEFRPRGPIRGALLDLRAVVLTPRGE
ncbi:MAG TPA: c-type cytochrome, partial [Isosphaeraceae bacterium]|nr:c-type cytochrome [Isosphaeraceae bacterium]